MKCQAVCFKQRGCSVRIFNSAALQADHEKVKKNSNSKTKKKERKKRNVEVLLQLRKKLIRIVHGCRYSVASDKWADCTVCSTVLICMRAVIESAKFEKKVERRYNAARQKGKKKVLLQRRNKLIRSVHSCRCSVASHKWADCGTVIKSANLKKK